jgi:GT2 family glycosyltransferase
MTPGLVSELVRVAESDARIAVVGCRNVLMEDPHVLWGAYGELTYGPFVVRTAGERVVDGESWHIVRDVDSVIGNGYLWRRAALERIGLLDENFFGYHEDLDWCLRARCAGHRVVYAGTAAIIHKGGSSSDRRQARSFPMSYFLGRNGVLFVRKHGNRLETARFALLCGAALGYRWLRALLVATVNGGDRGRAFVSMERGFTRGLWDALRKKPVPFGDLGLDDAV